MQTPFKVPDVKCAVYARVSTDMPGQKDSMENQKSFFEHYIYEKGWTNVGVYADEGITGTSTAKRYELQRLMKDAKRGLFNMIVIKSLSRFARDTVDGLTLVRQLKSYGVTLITIDENYNSSKDKGEVLLTAYFMVAQQESEAASRRIKFGIAEKSRNGVFHGTAPFGYDKKQGKLVPNEEFATIVKTIYELYLDKHWGFQKIANYLTDEGIPTPRTIRKAKNASDIWQENTVEGILRNRHYTGSLYQGRTSVNIEDKTTLSEKGYKTREDIKPESWKISQNTHEVIIALEKFELVQERIAYRSSKKFRGKGKKSLFARIAYCADCGKGMNYKNDRKGYVCGTYQKQGSKKCASHFINHELLKNSVLQDIQSLAMNAIDQEVLINSALKQMSVNTERFKRELNRAIKEIDERKKELVELVRMLTKKLIDEATFKYTNAKLSEDIVELEKRTLELNVALENEKQNETFMKEFQIELQRFTSLDINDEEILRTIFVRLIEQVDIQKDGSIVIHYNFRNPLN